MKKFIIIGVGILACLFVIYLMNIKENHILDNVHYIHYKVSSEKGIVEGEMSSLNVNEFIKLVNNLNLEEIKESEQIKGWLISLDCLNDKKEYMYNVYLVGDLFYIDETAYRINEDDLKQLHHFIDKLS